MMPPGGYKRDPLFKGLAIAFFLAFVFYLIIHWMFF